MNYRIKVLLPVLLITFAFSCSPGNQGSTEGLSLAITPEDVQTHIAFLADDSMQGRETGTTGEVRAANYIADHFREFGLEPAGENDTYMQEFTVNMAVLDNPHNPGDGSSSRETRISRNVIGIIEGSEQPDTYIVIGAHYDHLGTGSYGSLNPGDDEAIHNGADDNASGTAGLLELAQYFSRHVPQKSLVFIAFSGEELGLLGSQHFVEHPTVPLEQVAAMINMDMIGRMQDDKLIIFGTGSSPEWENLIGQTNAASLSIDTVPDGAGASDHTSFYNKNIPVLHYFTDTHADYHRPSDDTDYINIEGTSRILKHIRGMVTAIGELSDGQLAFTEAPSTNRRNMTLNGVTLGVTPDYGYNGKGMRITGVHDDGPAGRAGLRSGDVIVGLNGQELQDIYEYMEVLNSLEEGEQTTVTVVREGKELTFELAL